MRMREFGSEKRLPAAPPVSAVDAHVQPLLGEQELNHPIAVARELARELAHARYYRGVRDGLRRRVLGA